MACDRCNHKGYVERQIRINSRWHSQTAQCTWCKDTRAYAARVKQLLNHDYSSERCQHSHPTTGLQCQKTVGHLGNCESKAPPTATVEKIQWKRQGYSKPEGAPCPVIPFRRKEYL